MNPGALFQSLESDVFDMPRNRAKLLKSLAEWTGLEPATPGVTGRGANRALARVSGRFHIPKTADSRSVLPGMGRSYSKEMTDDECAIRAALMLVALLFWLAITLALYVL
jgi:hypothetical protein